MSRHSELNDWIMNLPSEGRYSFSAEEAHTLGSASVQAVQATLRRLKARGLIVTPRRGFHVVVPAEYRAAGSPPASWFIDDLMNHLGRRYYVALLSAAALHGAGHQQPMVFQVMTDEIERDIEVGRVRIQFHVTQRFDGAAPARMQTATGAMNVATPETIAFDLVRFPAASGFWSNIATVLSELVESIDAERLFKGAHRVARSDVQRLGWLLDRIGAAELAERLHEALAGQRFVRVPLNTDLPVSSADVDEHWRVIVNDAVEVEG